MNNKKSKEKQVRAFKHQWGFMGNEVGSTHRSDLAYCPLCNQWTWGDTDANGKEILFKMSKEDYLALIENGEIDGV